MTNTRPELALSPIETIVLSRLSCTKAPSENVVAKTVTELALPTRGGNALEIAKTSLNNLRNRGLIQSEHRVMTDAGHRALQAAFGLPRTPLWKDIHVSHLLAAALGLQPGTNDTAEAMKDAESVARTFLNVLPAPRRVDKTADKLLVELLQLSSNGLTLGQIRTEIADRFIRETLGLSGDVNLARMRAHARAQQANGHAHPVAGSKQELLQQISAKLGEPCEDKSSMRRALIRHWVYQGVQTRAVETPRASSPQASLPLSSSGTSFKPTAIRGPHTPVPQPSLLQTVRDTLPRVGADGRFGPEKVFISALWHRLERDRALNLTLDRFKTWLIDANREQQIDLVRADLVGAMDPKLVAESEIEDLGATFHFVVDRQAGNRRPHA